jgi:hypothetical protein
LTLAESDSERDLPALTRIDVGATPSQLFWRDSVSRVLLAVGLAVEATLIFLASTAPGLWQANPSRVSIVLFIVEALLAAFLPWFVIGIPFVRSADRSIATLLTRLGATDAWKVSGDDDFDEAIAKLGAKIDAHGRVTQNLYFVVGDSQVSFWSRRDTAFELLLALSRDRIAEADRRLTASGVSYFPGVRLSVTAPRAQQIDLRFIPNISHWKPGPVIARQIIDSLGRG